MKIGLNLLLENGIDVDANMDFDVVVDGNSDIEVDALIEVGVNANVNASIWNFFTFFK